MLDDIVRQERGVGNDRVQILYFRVFLRFDQSNDLQFYAISGCLFQLFLILTDIGKGAVFLFFIVIRCRDQIKGMF